MQQLVVACQRFLDAPHHSQAHALVKECPGHRRVLCLPLLANRAGFSFFLEPCRTYKADQLRAFYGRPKATQQLIVDGNFVICTPVASQGQTHVKKRPRHLLLHVDFFYKASQ